MRVLLGIGALASVAMADVYMHHPRGSNNRCDEKSNNRQNAQRMFDSENNAAGGYNFPGYYMNTTFDEETKQCEKNDKFYIYGGTQMNIVWTSQHGCGIGNDCNIVLQMGYQHEASLPYLRDGRPELRGIAFNGEPTENGDGSACTETPPEVPHLTYIECLKEFEANGRTATPTWTEKCITPFNNDVNEGDYEGDETNNGGIFDVCTYGQHESYENYAICQKTEGNRGLWHATENVNENQGAMATRQNNNGQRHGFECSEERDYYPYWGHSPWVTFAYLTSNVERDCQKPGIRQGSEERDYKKTTCRCTRGDNWEKLPFEDDEQKIPISKQVCELPGSTLIDEELNAIEAGSGNPKWECGQSAGDAYVSHRKALKSFGINDWKYRCKAVPSSYANHLGPATMKSDGTGNNGEEHYYATYPWVVPNPTKAMQFTVRIRYNITTPDADGLTSANNGQNSPIKDDKYFVSNTDVMLRIAINDNQIPRAFEDRSYVWEMRPKSLAGSCALKNIYNVNVMGKRGNIAQVRNCIEYFFEPQVMTMNQDDCVHFQWTGSDYNSNGNDGEGKAGSDRNNLLLASDSRTINGMGNFGGDPNFASKEDMLRLASQDQPHTDPESCYTQAECGLVGNGVNTCNNNQQNEKNCALLNRANAYFDGGAMEISANPGTYHFMSTRNNNFSNRDQKLTMHVTLSTTTVAIVAVASSVAFIGIVAGVVFFLFKKGLLQKATYKKVDGGSSTLASGAERI